VGWLRTLSDAHIKFASVFQKLDELGKNHADLTEETLDSRERIARLEGAMAQTVNPEIYRQVAELQTKVAKLEMYIRMTSTGSEQRASSASRE
jgi:hypothetical protein